MSGGPIRRWPVRSLNDRRRSPPLRWPDASSENAHPFARSLALRCSFVVVAAVGGVNQFGRNLKSVRMIV